MTEPTRSRYHHGNLRAALIDAGVELAREGGPQAVVLREASRRVGVSHNAAYRHFPDRDALLAAVAERCMDELAQLMERMLDEVGPAADARSLAEARLRAVGAAYVHFALADPGLFRAAFAPFASHPPGGPEEAQTKDGRSPYVLLGSELDGLVAAGVMDPADRPGAEMTAWSAVHGLSCLLLDGPLRALSPDEREAALQRLLSDVGRGLGSGTAPARTGGDDAARG